MLFRGYTTFDVGVLGPRSAATIFFTVMYLIDRTNRGSGFRFAIINFLIAVLLMSRSRNIAMVSCISLILEYFHRKRISYVYFVALAFLIIAVAVAVAVGVGIFRLGFEFNLEAVLTHFFADAFFIKASSFCVLDGGRNAVQVDMSFFAAFIAWIPSFLFESKYQFLIDLGVHRTASCSPFGGAGLIGQLYSNFGFFYFLYVVLIGFYYGYLYKLFRRAARFWRAIYFVSLPLLMFHFFNQHVYAYIKILVFNVLIFSLGAVLVLGMVRCVSFRLRLAR